MRLYEVIKAFIDIDGEIKTIGQIITVADNREDKLISGGYIIPIPSLIAESFLKQINDKLGINTDLWKEPTKSVLSYCNATYKHIHNPGYCLPADGTVTTVTSSATAGVFGDFVDVVGANVIEVAFDIHWLTITDTSANGVYVIELHRLDGAGASVELLCQVPTSRTDNFTRVGEAFTQIPVQPPNSRIGARVLKSTSGAGSVSFIAHYHDYE